MEKAQAISEAQLAAKLGQRMDVIVDELDAEGIATCRTKADAPEIDGAVSLRNVPVTLQQGAIVEVEIEDADAHDLFGVIAE